MVPDSAEDQQSPEYQALFPVLPPGWGVTEERAGTHLTSSLTFTPTLQDHWECTAEPVIRTLQTWGRIYIPAPSQARDVKSYSVESELCLPTGPEEDGVEHLCCVEHEVLKKPKFRASGQLWLQGHSETTKASNT
ncbi:hypothetical protein Y1Q_0005400 [Alligator mississippiensis]|uniref:Uncharacterized protein n=1 Tax=Alligator mississippiensis TaxID=8496 RepID=A0A151NCK9_ALLMI|nr:hypothetical protein Y1Q_0005400 [Alligator mississippiensis]